MLCKYRFHGTNATGEKCATDWVTVTKDDMYQMFDTDVRTSQGELVMETTELDDLVEECMLCLEKIHLVTTLECGYRFHSDRFTQGDLCSTCEGDSDLLGNAAQERCLEVMAAFGSLKL